MFLNDFVISRCVFYTGSGCDIFWKINADTQICYQINLLSVLSWNEARVACQGQGADLLSITDMREQKYIGGLIGKFKSHYK